MFNFLIFWYHRFAETLGLGCGDGAAMHSNDGAWIALLEYRVMINDKFTRFTFALFGGDGAAMHINESLFRKTRQMMELFW